jgi:hypothetical protein
VEATEVPGDPTLPFDRFLVEGKFRRIVTAAAGAAEAEEALTRCSDAIASGDLSSLM